MISKIAGLARRYHHFNLVLLDQAMVSGSNFLIGILLARLLGLEAFGWFTLAWIVVLFIQSLQQAMIIAPMMTIGGQTDETDHPSYFGAVIRHQFWFFLISTLLTLTILAIWSYLFGELDYPAILALTVLVAASQWQEFLRRYHFTVGQTWSAAASDAGRYLSQVIALALLTFLLSGQITVETALWIKALASLTGALVALVRLRPRRWSTPTYHDVTRQHWAFGKWLAGSTLLRWASSNLFVLAAAALIGPAAVGGIRAAETLMGATHVFFQAMENAIPPRAARLFRDGGTVALHRLMGQLAVVGGGITLGLALALSAAPGFWLGSVFGAEYAAYAHLVKWFGLIYLVMFVNMVLRIGLRTMSVTRPIFIVSVIVSGFSALAAYPLTAWLGLGGTIAGLVAVPVLGAIFLAQAYAAALRDKQREPGA